MDSVIAFVVVITLMSAIVHMFLMLVALQRFENESGKKPPALRWWAFNGEIKTHLPILSKLGRFTFYLVLPSWGIAGWFAFQMFAGS